MSQGRRVTGISGEGRREGEIEEWDSNDPFRPKNKKAVSDIQQTLLLSLYSATFTKLQPQQGVKNRGHYVRQGRKGRVHPAPLHPHREETKQSKAFIKQKQHSKAEWESNRTDHLQGCGKNTACSEYQYHVLLPHKFTLRYPTWSTRSSARTN